MGIDAPPVRRSSWAWEGLLALVLLACLPPLVVNLSAADITRIMENISLLSSQETWLREHGAATFDREPHPWLMPTWNGRPRVTKPPMLVWVNLLAWADLDPDTANPDRLTLRARLASVAMAELLVASVFWIGLTLGDRRHAAVAALAVGSTWFFQRQGRTAAYDIHFAGWATLGAAAALWSVARSRRAPEGFSAATAAGWGLAGAALAAAWLTKNPLALMLVAVPAALTIALGPPPRRRDLVGLAGAILFACVLAFPWYVYARLRVPHAWATWLHESAAERNNYQPPYFYLGLLGLLAPWTIWLVAGLVQPFLPEHAHERRRLLLPWLWFALIFAAFSIHGAKQQRYILPIVPAAAVLCAQVFAHHQRLADAGRRDPGAARLYAPHWLALAAASLAAAAFPAAQPWLLDRGWLAWPLVRPTPAAAGPLLGAGLLAIAAIGWRWHRRWQPTRAAAATGAWGLLLTAALWAVYAHDAKGDEPARGPGMSLAAEVGNRRLAYLRLGRGDHEPSEELLYYLRRVVKPIAAEDLAAWAEESRGALDLHAVLDFRHPRVIAVADEPHDTAMRRAGFAPVATYPASPWGPFRLWRAEKDPASRVAR